MKTTFYLKDGSIIELTVSCEKSGNKYYWVRETKESYDGWNQKTRISYAKYLEWLTTFRESIHLNKEVNIYYALDNRHEAQKTFTTFRELKKAYDSEIESEKFRYPNRNEEEIRGAVKAKIIEREERVIKI